MPTLAVFQLYCGIIVTIVNNC